MLREAKVLIGFLLLGLATYVHAEDALVDNRQVNVFVIDDAGALQLLADAERTATRVFLQAGVNVAWVNCRLSSPSPCPSDLQPGDFMVRIIPRPRSHQQEMFGVSFLAQDGAGAYADVFLEPIEQLRETTSISLSATLGDVIVHELGHLLLGPNAHSPEGIMQAHWQSEQLRAVGQGRMLFSPDQARRIRNKIGTLQRCAAEFGLPEVNH